MMKIKIAEPVSVELCEYAQDANGLYMSVATVKLCVNGDCVSKSYKGNRIESLNPPIAWCGVFHSVNYCPDTNTTTIEYRFEPHNCILNYRTHARLFATRMQRRINRNQIKDFKAEIAKKANENIK